MRLKPRGVYTNYTRYEPLQAQFRAHGLGPWISGSKLQVLGVVLGLGVMDIGF